MVERKRVEEGISIKGLGASPGIVSGSARIIHNIQDLERLRTGDVLITPTATPDIIIAIKKAAAVITEAGGMTSHAATICRYFGIPCVVGVERATRSLKDDMIVTVDGDRGVVYGVGKPTKMKLMSTEEKREFEFAGRKITSVLLKMDRDGPLWPQHWDTDWPKVNMDRTYHWIPYRPELYVEPVASFLLSAIEKGPYLVGLEVGPLHARFHNCNFYLRLDKVQEALGLVADRILSQDETFLGNFRWRVEEAYDKLDRVTREAEAEQHRFGEMTPTELLDLFKRWWRACDDFFSLNILIAAMGTDIVWPEIRRILKELFMDEAKASRYMAILSKPSTDLDSIRFYHDCNELIDASQRVRSLIISNLSPKETLDIIRGLDEGKEWLIRFEEFIQKWGWMRDRLLYCEPLRKEEEMIGFLKKHFSSSGHPSSSIGEITELDSTLQDIKNLIPDEKSNAFKFYLNLGRFLQRERDNRYVFMMKNSDVVRRILIELGTGLKNEGVIYDEKDIFFLLIQEVFELFSLKTSDARKAEITSKIPNRMTALTYVSKLRLHPSPGYDPKKIPVRDSEFY